VLSPDGRYVAYVSTESGRAEIYVQSFSGLGGKWQISSDGGIQPHWRADGKELFYLAFVSDQLMAVEVTTGDKFEAKIPTVLFTGHIALGGRNTFLPSKDGQRFLLVSTPPGEATSPTTIVLNWMAQLGK
jgi:eukaryotic-like serine/threonine-protein kinase